MLVMRCAIVVRSYGDTQLFGQHHECQGEPLSPVPVELKAENALKWSVGVPRRSFGISLQTESGTLKQVVISRCE